jgi:hypothetical protein
MTSKADQKRAAAYTRASVRRKVEEYTGGAEITYFLDDEQTTKPFIFPHPFFYTEEQNKALEDLKDSDTEGRARELLGDAEYERFIAEGGTNEDIQLFLIAVGRDLADKANPR